MKIIDDRITSLRDHEDEVEDCRVWQQLKLCEQDYRPYYIDNQLDKLVICEYRLIVLYSDERMIY